MWQSAARAPPRVINLFKTWLTLSFFTPFLTLAEVVMPRVCCALLIALILVPASWAGDDLAQSLGEEASGEDAAAEVSLPRAENVDLKEVISRPLHEALPVNSAPTPEAAGPVTAPAPAQQPVKIPDVPAPAAPPSQAPATGAPGAAPEVTSTESPPPSTELPSASVEPVVPAESVPPVTSPPESTIQPLRMLGAEVLPGTATRLAWSVKDSLAGISVPTPVLVVHGAQPGPVVCLTAALHGDELNGIEVVRRILYDLQPDKLTGTVIGVPIVNLQGFRRASRYLPDRRDLNRYFPGRPNGSSAARIAHSFFTEVIQHCNILVDLHTGSFRRTNLPQLRADLTTPAVAELTRNMGAIVVLQSKGARGSLRRAAVDVGIPAVTVEAGEPLNVEPDAVQQGVHSIEALLSKLNMYPYKGLWARKTEPVYYKSRWIRVPSGGILLNTVRLGERVKKDQVLGSVTDPITNVSQPIASPIAGRVIGMALNQVMLPGFAAYHLGYQATAEEAAETDAGPDEAVGDDAEVEESEEGFESGPPNKSSE